MTPFPSIFRSKTIQELLKDTQHELGQILANYKRYRASHKKKLRLVHKFMGSWDSADFKALKQEISEINALILLDFKLEQKEEWEEEIAEKKIEEAIEKEDNPKIKAKLEELREDLLQLLIIIEKLKPLLKKQLNFLKKPVPKQQIRIQEFLAYLKEESFLLGFYYNPDGSSEDKLLHKIMVELWEIANAEKQTKDTYKLPVPPELTTGVGIHPFEHVKYAWDFIVKDGTPVFVAKDGKVVYVKVDSKLEGNDQLINILYWRRRRDFEDFARSNPRLMQKIFRKCKSAENAYRRGNIKKAMTEVYLFYFRNNNLIIIEHEDRKFSAYVHLKYLSTKVKKGQKVSQGQKIALAGNTGTSTMPHLHFEVYVPFQGYTAKQAFLKGARKPVPIKFIQ